MVDHQSLLGGHAMRTRTRTRARVSGMPCSKQRAQSAPHARCLRPEICALFRRPVSARMWILGFPQRSKQMMYCEHNSAYAAMPRPLSSMRRHGRPRCDAKANRHIGLCWVCMPAITCAPCRFRRHFLPRSEPPRRHSAGHPP